MACLGGTAESPRRWHWARADGWRLVEGRHCDRKDPRTNMRSCSSCPAYRGRRWDGTVADGFSPAGEVVSLADRDYRVYLEDPEEWLTRRQVGAPHSSSGTDVGDDRWAAYMREYRARNRTSERSRERARTRVRPEAARKRAWRARARAALAEERRRRALVLELCRDITGGQGPLSSMCPPVNGLCTMLTGALGTKMPIARPRAHMETLFTGGHIIATLERWKELDMADGLSPAQVALEERIATGITWLTERDPDGRFYLWWRSGLRGHSPMPAQTEEVRKAYAEWCRGMQTYERLEADLEKLAAVPA